VGGGESLDTETVVIEMEPNSLKFGQEVGELNWVKGSKRGCELKIHNKKDGENVPPGGETSQMTLQSEQKRNRDSGDLWEGEGNLAGGDFLSKVGDSSKRKKKDSKNKAGNPGRKGKQLGSPIMT